MAFAVLGNAITSRRLCAPASSMTMRSKPNANPACGGAPNRKASSRKPKRACAVASSMPMSEKIRMIGSVTAGLAEQTLGP